MFRNLQLNSALLLALTMPLSLFMGCSDDGSAALNDAGSTTLGDAGNTPLVDAATVDAATVDAATVDAATVDAGPPPPEGSEGGACYANSTCNGTLVCESDICVGVVYDIAEQGANIVVLGNVDATGMVFDRRAADCSEDTSEGTNNNYEALTIRNATGAAQKLDFLASWARGNGFLHVYSTFDPELPTAGCIIGNNDFPGSSKSGFVDVDIADGETLIVVASAYRDGSSVEDFSVTITTQAPQGALGGPCFGNNTCNIGGLDLQCMDGYCIDAACLVASDNTVCVLGSNNVFNADACFVAENQKTTCSSSLPCEVLGDGQAYCSCPFTGANECKIGGALSTLYEETYIQKERECTNSVDTPSDFVEDCGFGSVCFHEDAINGGAPLCRRSITESQSGAPYYNFGCGTFSRLLRHPTSLEIDCRCRTTGDGQGGAGGTGNAYADPNNIDINNGARPGGPIVNCAAQGQMASTPFPIQYGTGPSFNAWYQQNNSGASWFSATVDPIAREMFAIVRWSSPTHVRSASIVAWDLDTKDRRVVTGYHPGVAGEVEYGSGYMSITPQVGAQIEPTQPLSGASVVRFGPDGMLYTMGGGLGEVAGNDTEIVRIDPSTGLRTLVWRAQNADTGDITGTFGQCFRPDAFGNFESIAYQPQAFEVGPDGTFYMSMHGIREGDGIVTISADGQTCTVVSRWGGLGHDPGGGPTAVPAPDAIGSGPELQFPVKGLLYQNGLIHGVSNDNLYGFNLGTSDWTLESYTNATYGGMGYANMFHDPSRDVIWAVGTVASRVGSIVDLTTGRRESIYGDTGNDEYGNEAILRSVYAQSQSVSGHATMLSNGNTLNYGGVILDPADNNIVYGVVHSGGLMKLELSTFNNYVHSW